MMSSLPSGEKLANPSVSRAGPQDERQHHSASLPDKRQVFTAAGPCFDPSSCKAVRFISGVGFAQHRSETAMRLIIEPNWETLLDKSKPVARRGRKATDQARSLTAGLPKEDVSSASRGLPIGRSPSWAIDALSTFSHH